MIAPDDRNSSRDCEEDPPGQFASSPCYLHEFEDFDVVDSKSPKRHILVKRIYEPASEKDGRRYLVDRLWPRGLSKEKADLTAWLKEIAPSADLRQWFHQDPSEWEEFSRRYHAELQQLKSEKNGQLEQLEQAMENGPVTLLYASRDELHNHARLLKDFLRG